MPLFKESIFVPQSIGKDALQFKQFLLLGPLGQYFTLTKYMHVQCIKLGNFLLQ